MADGLTTDTLIEGFSLNGTPSPGAQIALDRLRTTLQSDASAIATRQLRGLITSIVDNGNGTVTINPGSTLTLTDGPGMARIGF